MYTIQMLEKYQVVDSNKVIIIMSYYEIDILFYLFNTIIDKNYFTQNYLRNI